MAAAVPRSSPVSFAPRTSRYQETDRCRSLTTRMCVSSIGAQPRLARRHDRRRAERHIVEIRVRVDIGFAVDDLRLEARQSRRAVAQLTPAVAVPEIVQEDAHGEVNAGSTAEVGLIRRQFDALEGGAFPEVLRKRARVRTGIVWKLPDLLSTPLLDHLCQRGELERDVTAELGRAELPLALGGPDHRRGDQVVAMLGPAW